MDTGRQWTPRLPRPLPVARETFTSVVAHKFVHKLTQSVRRGPPAVVRFPFPSAHLPSPVAHRHEQFHGAPKLYQLAFRANPTALVYANS